MGSKPERNQSCYHIFSNIIYKNIVTSTTLNARCIATFCSIAPKPTKSIYRKYTAHTKYRTYVYPVSSHHTPKTSLVTIFFTRDLFFNIFFSLNVIIAPLNTHTHHTHLHPQRTETYRFMLVLPQFHSPSSFFHFQHLPPNRNVCAHSILIWHENLLRKLCDMLC